MQALAGIRVLDLSRLLPGPFASMVLADLGATVDKLEEPHGGDPLRKMPPLVKPAQAAATASKDAAASSSSLFLSLNRNKRSFTLDLKDPLAQAAFRRLLPRYDVILEQFRPGVLDRLGLSAAAMMALHPGLVVCSLTGYGQDGPLAQRAGHDLNYLARAGVLFAQGPVDGPPTLPGVQMADVGGALWAVIAILSALSERERTGKGKHLDVSMLEASLGFGAITFGLLAGGVTTPPAGAPLTGSLAGYATYVTKDGRSMALGALEPKFLAAFLDAVGIAFEPSMAMPGPQQRALRARLTALFLEKTQREWVELAGRGDFCLEPVLSPEEALDDSHLQARAAFFRLASPWGDILQARTPVTPIDAEHRAPPLLGADTEQVLSEAGFTAAEIAALTPGPSRD